MWRRQPLEPRLSLLRAVDSAVRHHASRAPDRLQSVLGSRQIPSGHQLRPHGRVQRHEMNRCLVDARPNRPRSKLLRAAPGVADVALLSPRLWRHRDHHLRRVWLQELVQPGAVRALLEADVQPSTDPLHGFHERPAIRVHHDRPKPLARRPHHRQRAARCVRIDPDVALHTSPPCLGRTVGTAQARTGPTRRYPARAWPWRRRRPAPFPLCLL